MTPSRTRFVILAQRRTGSTHLVSLLDSHPDIRSFGELLRTPREKTPEVVFQHAQKFHNDKYRHDHYRDFLRAVFSSEPTGRARVLGFKLMLDDNRQALSDLIDSRNWKVIYIRRENELAAYASEKIARETGQGIVRLKTRIIRHRTNFDADEFERFMSRRSEERASVEKLLELSEKKYFALEYREIREKKVHHKLKSYLNVDLSFDLVSTTRKRNTSQILNRFANTDDVRRYLKASGLSRWGFEKLGAR